MQQGAWLALVAAAALAGCEITSTGARPVITNAPPATATEDVAYAHQALSADADGPSATWSLTGDHTCGGALDPDTGLFTFTPAGPVPIASCVVALKVCDGSELNWCATQATVVSIVATDDPPTITSVADEVAVEGVPYAYQARFTDADGPSAIWSLRPEHTCGGAIDAATGAFTFTPGDAPPPTCTLAIRVCDGGAADACATQTTTVAITPKNDAPAIDSVAPTTAVEGSPSTYAATATDPDGPGAVWSLGADHSCGGAIDAATGVLSFVPAGPASPTACRLTIRVCDGGAPSLCATQTAVVAIVTHDDPPTAVDDRVAIFHPAAPTIIRVLDNDDDPDAGPKALATVTQPAHGTVTAAGNEVTYLPAAGYCNEDTGVLDTFTYRLAPGGASATVSVWIECPQRGFARFATGDAHSCEVRPDGTLWCWGANVAGQVGDGTNLARSAPTQVGDATSWATVEAGAIHTCATRTDGTLWCWGQGDGGQLGDGTTFDRPAPIQVGSDTTWARVSAGDSHTCGTLTDGTALCWGWNAVGQITGGMPYALVPRAINISQGWNVLSCGNSFTAGIRANTSMWQWGELREHTGAIRQPIFFAAPPWTTVSAGRNHACGLQVGGSLWCWGDNASRQLGDGSTLARSTPTPIAATTRWLTVSAGRAHTCAIALDGSLWCWGANDRGQLGDGTNLGRATPTRVGTALDWQAVSAGGAHTCARRVDGTRWCWGANDSGQLGDGTNLDRFAPTQLAP